MLYKVTLGVCFEKGVGG